MAPCCLCPALGGGNPPCCVPFKKGVQPPTPHAVSDPPKKSLVLFECQWWEQKAVSRPLGYLSGIEMTSSTSSEAIPAKCPLHSLLETMIL